MNIQNKEDNKRLVELIELEYDLIKMILHSLELSKLDNPITTVENIKLFNLAFSTMLLSEIEQDVLINMAENI